MATILNDPGCVTAAGNTGNPGCFVAMKAIKGMILVPAGTTYTITTLAAFKTALQAATLAAGAARIYPIGPFEETTDNSTAMSPIELGHGGSLPGKEGK